MDSLKVFIVDDDPEVSAFTRLRLSDEKGFSLTVFESAGQCLEYLKQNKADCILSDYQMPEMDGMELLSSLRAEGNEVPFIFLTGHGSEEVAREAFKQGAFDYFVKDQALTNFTRIKNSIRQAVRQKRAEARKAKMEEALKVAAISLSARTGESFLDSVAEYLAKSMGVKYAFVGEVSKNDPGSIDTISLFAGSAMVGNITYNLKDTPCENVVGKEFCCYPSGIQGLFPKDALLAEMGAESYAGAPLFDLFGKPLGLLVVLDDKPFEDRELVENLLKIFAARAAAELERRIAEKELFDSQERYRRREDELEKFRRLVEWAGEEIYILTLSGRIAYANEAAAKSLGYSKQAMLGLPVEKFNPKYARKFNDYIASLKYGDLPPFEVEHITRTGAISHKEIKSVYLRLGDNDYICTFARDITERKRLERQRSDIYAMVTHDLKSPISALLGYSDYILTEKRGLCDDETLAVAANIKKIGTKVYRMLDDFLTLARLENKGGSLNISEIDLREFLWTVGEEFLPLAKEKGVVFDREIGPGAKAVNADRLLLQRAIANLVQNAISYTGKGGQVTLRASAAGKDGEDYILFSISDTGMGVPEKDRERIFEKYYRSSKAAGIKGSGLGLAIVKAVAEAHSGNVDLSSSEGAGSVFTLCLPLKH